MKKIFTTSIFAFLCLIFILNFAGCSATSKTYKSTSGISIQLTDNFVEKQHISSATYYLQSEDVVFLAIKEVFDDLSIISVNENSTLTDYANVVIESNMMETTIKTAQGLTYFTYTATARGKDFYYLAMVFKGSDGFWLCQFGCLSSDQEFYTQTFLDWGNTIVVE